MGHHNNNKQARFSVLVRRPAVVQAHIKLPTLGKHQSLSVGGGVRQAFHEAADFTLVGGVGRVWFSRVGVSVNAAGGWLGMGWLGDVVGVVACLMLVFLGAIECVAGCAGVIWAGGLKNPQWMFAYAASGGRRGSRFPAHLAGDGVGWFGLVLR